MSRWDRNFNRIQEPSEKVMDFIRKEEKRRGLCDWKPVVNPRKVKLIGDPVTGWDQVVGYLNKCYGKI